MQVLNFKYVNHVLAFYSLGGLSFNSNEQELASREFTIIFNKKSHWGTEKSVVKYWLAFSNTEHIANKMLGKRFNIKDNTKMVFMKEYRIKQVVNYSEKSCWINTRYRYGGKYRPNYFMKFS